MISEVGQDVSEFLEERAHRTEAFFAGNSSFGGG